jgi:hypothetical protein
MVAGGMCPAGENAEKQLGLERKERGLTANRAVRLELRVQALKRRRERLQAELCKFQDPLARADVPDRIRELRAESTTAAAARRPAELISMRSSGRRILAEPAPPGTRAVIFVVDQRQIGPKP